MPAIKNTLIVLDSTTLAANIKPALIDEMLECSRVTGKTLSRLLNEAIHDFMTLQGSIYMNEAGHDAPCRTEARQREKA